MNKKNSTVEMKIPPHSKEGEKLVLGAMIVSINSLNIAAGALEEIDFYYVEHRTMFQVLYDFYRRDQSVDIHLITEELKRLGKLEEIGGIEYLMDLAQNVGSSLYVEEYIKLIKDKSLLRKIIDAAQMTEKEAFQEPSDVDGALDLAQQRLFAITQTKKYSLGISIKQLIQGEHTASQLPLLELIEQRQVRFEEMGGEGIPLTGVSTHFTELDRLIDGLAPSNLLILAARPAMGKTALALNIASNVAFKENVPVAFFSLEMSAEQLLHRLICSHAQVETDKMHSGELSGEAYQRIVSSVHEMQEHTMIIEDQPGLRITDLRSRARRMKEAYDIRLIVIDYLQLISGSQSGRAMENRQLEIAEISRTLKVMAKELDIPVLCLSQLSRRVEERSNHRPMMSDLRESGSIEQDADVIMFLLREEYYDPHKKPGMAEIIVGKNRHGGIGSVTLTWLQNFQQFQNCSFAHHEDEHEMDFA